MTFPLKKTWSRMVSGGQWMLNESADEIRCCWRGSGQFGNGDLPPLRLLFLKIGKL
jgi:hypothetical protein